MRFCRPWSSPVARKREKREVITKALELTERERAAWQAQVSSPGQPVQLAGKHPTLQLQKSSFSRAPGSCARVAAGQDGRQASPAWCRGHGGPKRRHWSPVGAVRDARHVVAVSNTAKEVSIPLVIPAACGPGWGAFSFGPLRSGVIFNFIGPHYLQSHVPRR